MPFREPTLPLCDILDAIGTIEEFTSGMNFDKFRADPKTIAAVERKLLVIGEAAVRLGREAPFIVPEVPWRNVRGMGIGYDISMTVLICKWSGVPSQTISLL